MASYDLTIRVADEDKLSVIISALAGSGTILSLQATTIRKKTSKTFSYVDGKRNKGIKGSDLMVSLFKRKASWNTQALIAEFVKAGFSKNSMSPRLALLKKQGKIAQTSLGVYKWV